jgi:isochorismate hydrolase
MTDHEKVQQMVRLREQAPIAIDSQNCALLIVDVQRYFTRPDSAFAQVFQKLHRG